MSLAERLAALQSFIGDHPKFEDAYLRLLDWYAFHHQLPQAVEYFSTLLKHDDTRQYAYWMLAEIARKLLQTDSAFSYYHQAIRDQRYSWGLLNRYIDFAAANQGGENHIIRLKNSTQSKDTVRIIEAFWAYRNLEDKTAISYFQSLDLPPTSSLTLLDVRGYCYFYTDQPDKADSLWQIGLDSAKKKGNLKAEARFLSNQALLSKQVRKQIKKALSYHEQVEKIASETHDYYRLQIVFGYRGFLHRDGGKYSEAVDSFNKAIRIASRLKLPRFKWDWYRGLSMTYYYMGHYPSAFAYLDSSEALTTKLNNNDLLIRTLLDKSEIYIKLKQLHLAKSTLNEALTLANHYNKLSHQAAAKAKLGQILVLQKKYPDAEKALSNYIDFIKKNPAQQKNIFWGLGRIAYVHLKEENYTKSREIYREALQAAKTAISTAFQGWYQLYIGDCELALGNPDAAEKNYLAAQEIAYSKNIRDLLWQTYQGLGNVYKQTGEITEAIDLFSKAAKIVETTREELSVDRLRIGYFIDGHVVYNKLVSCYLTLYEQEKSTAYLDSIFQYHELGRSRALQDLRSAPQQKNISATYLKTQERLRQLQRKLRLRSPIDSTTNIKGNIVDELEITRLSMLAQQLRMFAKKETSNKHPVHHGSLSDLRQRVSQSDLGILIYHISNQASFVMSVFPDTMAITQLPLSADSIQAAIAKLVTPFHSFQVKTLNRLPFRTDIAYQLYRDLIAPIERQVDLPEQLLVVPDGALTNLPFEILLTDKPAADIYTPQDIPVYAADFLVNRYRFNYSPGASFLLSQTRLSPIENPSMLIVANPDFYQTRGLTFRQQRSKTSLGWQFSPLPFTELEARKIQDVYPNVTVQKRDRAIKSTLFSEIPKHQIIHLSTHGFVDTTFDAFSGLALTPGPDSTDDGLFMGYEMQNISFNCDLVTLSACETGRGRLVAGEGVLGLPRILLGAGAKSVLMTLWKVEDKFTSELMPAFYKHYFRENLNKASALTFAKRDIIRGNYAADQPLYYQHPFFWAAFTLYGDPGTINKSEPFSKLTLVLFLLGSLFVMLIALWVRRLIAKRQTIV